MKIAIYIRVSTEDQAKEGYSLEVQREYLESFAKRERVEIFKCYQDDGISGYTTKRPALQELLKDAKQKEFDLVLVYKIDRFSRNLKDMLNLVDELFSYGVEFKSATEPFDSTTSAGKLMLQQLGSFAEFERNRIKERVFPGMIKGVQKGNWQGARYAPYGYSYNKEKKLLEADDKEAKVVKIIYTMFLCDKSTRSITAYLTRKGYRNRKGNIFSTKLIGDILKNRIYIGKLLWNRKSNNPVIAQGRHEAMIAEEDFNLAQEKWKTRRVEQRKKANDYPLTGILQCAKCNHKYVGLSSISNHKTKEKKRWYRCSGPYRSFIRCKNKSVKALEMESQVADIIETLLKNDKLKKSRWTNVTTANFPVFAKNPKTDVKVVKNRLDKNLKKQSKLTDAYLENLLSEELYKRKNESLRQEEEELKKLIALQEVRTIEKERSREYLDKVEEFLEGYDPNKKEMDKETKKLIINLLFKNIKIAPRRELRPTGQAENRIKNFDLFAPFNLFYFQQKEKTQCQAKKRLTKNRPERSLSVLSDVK